MGYKLSELVHFFSSITPEDGNENDDIAVDEGYSLVLPSGKLNAWGLWKISFLGTRVGHRSLLRYYRQSLKPVSAQSADKNRKAINLITQQYKSIGWTGQSGRSPKIANMGGQ